MVSWDGMADGFLRQCQTRGLSPATIKTRERELDRWGIWMKRRRPKIDIETVAGEQIVDYIRARTKFRSKRTVASTMSVLRCMGAYLVQEGVWQKNPLQWIKGPRIDPRSQLPKRIAGSDMEKLWKTAAQDTQAYRRQLLLAMLGTLYSTGLRRGELVRLSLSDWNAEEGLFKLDGRKTGRERILPVALPVKQCIESYLPLRHNQLAKAGRHEESAMFVNRSGHRLKGEGVGRILHRLAKDAETPAVTPQCFRHTCASDLLASGVPLPRVQEMLGHATLVTTMRYIHVADPERRKAIDKHPINEMMAACLPQGDRQ